MISVKRLSGILNKDDKEADVIPFQHTSGRNIRFTGGGNGLTAEDIKGTVIIPNTDLPNGTNENNGTFFDSVKQRILWFNWNQYGNHGLYSYSIQTETVTEIFRCGVDSATDVLGLSLDYPVHSAAIVYRTTGDGDLLYWTNGYGRPMYLNLDTVSTLAPFTADMLNAAKNAPLTPPVLDYENDSEVNVNNLRKKLFRACYRWVYKNGEKSTFSPISKVPLPTNGYDPDTSNDPTLNNNITITVTGGGDDYDAIEVCGQFNVNDTWGDFFLIEKLQRDEYGILPDASYIYYFYNNGVYSTVNPEETDLYFSWLPDKANTLEVLNGNILIYGGITDGYDKLTREEVDVTVTSALSNPNIPTISFGYSGLHEITILVGSVIQVGASYSVYFTYSSGAGGDASPKNVSYVTLGGDTQTTVADALIALLNGNNISATNLGSGVIRVITSTGSGTITNVAVNVSVSGSEVAAASWKWSCPGRLGLVYFDERGKTNGVISFVSDDALDTTDFAFTTPDFNTNTNIPQVPLVAASINHTPPAWATSYQWVRADLLPTNFLYWVTNDYQADSDFLYFCIENLVYQQSQNTGFVPSYEFTDGDRIRVIAYYSGGNFIVYNEQLDMEILGTVQKTMTSPAEEGLFLKVAKPTTLPSSPYTLKMLVEVYTPKQRSSDTSQLFYEWGEKYDIYELGESKILTYTSLSGIFQIGETITQSFGGGGVGTITAVSSTHITVTVTSGTFGGGYTITGSISLATGVITNVADGSAFRYHRGQVNDQTASQPATFQWFDGDVYYRTRQWYENDGGTSLLEEYFMDANYSDYFESAVNSNGRGWVIDENAKEEYNQVLVRWGGKYQSGTNINQLNIFRPSDFDEADRSKGDIRRFKVRDRILRVFQDRGVGQYGIYARFIQNNEGVSDLVTTNEIITTNNIQYYLGVFGLGGYPTNLCSSPVADYFTDITTGRGVRLSGDGLTDLGVLYKGQYYFPKLVTPYNKTLLRSNGAKAKVMAFFDTFDGDFHTILQAGTANGTTTSNQHFSFNEARNGYVCDYYDYHPDWAISANDVIFSWKDGFMYKHTNESQYTYFYGVQYNAEITLVFNDNVNMKKSWNSIAEVANTTWACPLIYTNVNTYLTQRQETNLVDADFQIQEGMPTSAIKRDVHSVGGKVSGSFIKGNWMAVKLQKLNASNFVTLTEVIVRYTDSPLNIR